MAQTVSMRYVVFNNADNPQTLINSLTALTVDTSVIEQSPCYVYDNNGNLINNSTTCIFALNTTNDSAFRTTLVNGSAGFSTPPKTWAITGVSLG